MTLSTLRPLALLALLAPLGLAACGDDPAGPDEGGPTLEAPVELPVLGHGAVTQRYSAELSVRGGIAYTTTWGNRGGRRGNTIYVWDVAGAQPALLDSVTVPGAGTLGDVEVSADGRHLLVAQEPAPAGAFLLYSLQDPRRPALVTAYTGENVRMGVHTAELEEVGGRLYAFLSIDPGGETPARLVVVDLSDPARPREVFVQAMGQPFVHDVFVRDGYLFTANWDEGIVVWSIGAQGGSVAAPVRLGTLATVGGNVHNVWWFHDPTTGSKRYAFVGEEQSPPSGSAGDIHVVDVSDPRDPREVAFFTVPGAGTHNFWVDEPRGILYAAYYDGGLRALDVRGDLGSCAADQRDASGRCDLGRMGREVARALSEGRNARVWGVQQVGDALYASDMNNGLWKLDLTPLHRALGR